MSVTNGKTLLTLDHDELSAVEDAIHYWLASTDDDELTESDEETRQLLKRVQKRVSRRLDKLEPLRISS